MADIRDYEQIAEWWDEFQGDEGDLWHRTLIYPTIRRMCGDVAGVRVLDLACGNGSMSRWLARSGADVIGVDGSPSNVRNAQRREAEAPLRIEYRHSDAARLDFLPDESFDLALCTMALMDMTHEAADSAIHQMARVLKADGRCIMCFCHPCFDVPGYSSWLVEVTPAKPVVSRKVSRYRDVFEEPCLLTKDQPFMLRCYHRPLSWYFRAIRSASMAVTAFEENEPTPELVANDESSSGRWTAIIPVHCTLETRKLRL